MLGIVSLRLPWIWPYTVATVVSMFTVTRRGRKPTKGHTRSRHAAITRSKASDCTIQSDCT